MVEVVYGKTSEGLTAARVGSSVYCLVPSQEGLLIVYSHSDKSIEMLSRSDFYGHQGVVENEDSFRLEMEKRAHHQKQLIDLKRQDYPSSMRTPWGESQGGTIYSPGIHYHHTARHGGFKVYKKQNDLIPEMFRNKDGWYEEDCEWAKVANFHPAFFTDMELESAKTSLINWYPDEYEAFTGEVIPEGQSRVKDERIFQLRHAEDWVVISALGKTDEQGNQIVDCIATKGGKRSRYENNVLIEVEEAQFIVPAEEYQQRGPFGFVINLDSHHRVDEPEASAGMKF